MPGSLVLYSNKDIYRLFQETLADTFRDYPVLPYTLSFPQKTQGNMVRTRITELTDEAIGPIVRELVDVKQAVLASDSEPDVKSATYEDLQQAADRSSREIRLQFASPTLLRMGSYHVPFPVAPLLFRHYLGAWNEFSPEKIVFDPAALENIRVKDFRISGEKTSYGMAFQGWIELETTKGRTEDEIAAINMLCDFAFFCGTGLHTDRGLGQTRRIFRER